MSAPTTPRKVAVPESDEAFDTTLWPAQEAPHRPSIPILYFGPTIQLLPSASELVARPRPKAAPTESPPPRVAPKPPPAARQPAIPKSSPPRPRKRPTGHRVLRTSMAVLVALVLLAAAVVGVFALRWSPHRKPGTPVAPELRTTGLLAWSVAEGGHVYPVVVAVPARSVPVAVAMPSDVLVDSPGGGPSTIGEGALDFQTLVVVTQGSLDLRIDHEITMTGADLSTLVDRAGGVSLVAELPFTSNGHRMGPGQVEVKGADVLAYLDQGNDADRTGRWEDVPQGVLASSPGPSGWAQLGQGDDPTIAAKMLGSARWATVLELPTVLGVDGASRPNLAKVQALVKARFGSLAKPLVRVVVLNGNGNPGMGGAIGRLIAPSGFRVVASQNAGSFALTQTQVIASGVDLLGAANEVQALIGVGRVYVGDQPTGLADITIVVGKDFSQG